MPTPVRILGLPPEQRPWQCRMATEGLGVNGPKRHLNVGLVEESMLINPPGALSVIGPISSLWFYIPVQCTALRTSIGAMRVGLGQEIACDCKTQLDFKCSAVMEDLETCCADPLHASNLVLLEAQLLP